MLLLLSLLFLGTGLSSAVLPTVSPGIVTVDGRGWSHVGAFFTHKRVSLSAAAMVMVSAKRPAPGFSTWPGLPYCLAAH